MFNFNPQLFHLHGGDREAMRRVEHHDASAHDIERALARGGQIFRCDTCAEEVLVVPAEDPHGERPVRP